MEWVISLLMALLITWCSYCIYNRIYYGDFYDRIIFGKLKFIDKLIIATLKIIKILVILIIFALITWSIHHFIFEIK